MRGARPVGLVDDGADAREEAVDNAVGRGIDVCRGEGVRADGDARYDDAGRRDAHVALRRLSVDVRENCGVVASVEGDVLCALALVAHLLEADVAVAIAWRKDAVPAAHKLRVVVDRDDVDAFGQFPRVADPLSEGARVEKVVAGVR